MNIEDALNLELSAYRVERIVHGPDVQYRAEIPGYPQCTAAADTVEEALRAARHTLTELRDRQTAVAVSEMTDAHADRLREALRTVVTRALI